MGILVNQKQGAYGDPLDIKSNCIPDMFVVFSPLAPPTVNKHAFIGGSGSIYTTSSSGLNLIWTPSCDPDLILLHNSKYNPLEALSNVVQIQVCLFRNAIRIGIQCDLDVTVSRHFTGKNRQKSPETLYNKPGDSRGCQWRDEVVDIIQAQQSSANIS